MARENPYSTVSDDQGRYITPEFHWDYWIWLYASAAGYCEEYLNMGIPEGWKPPGASKTLPYNVDLQLDPVSVSMEGQVLSAGGAPVTDATVRILVAGNQVDRGNVAAFTDDRGRFRMGFKAEGPMLIQSISPEHGHAIFADVRAVSGKTVLLRYPHRHTLSGRITFACMREEHARVLVWSRFAYESVGGGTTIGIGPTAILEVGYDGYYGPAALPVLPGILEYYVQVVGAGARPLSPELLLADFDGTRDVRWDYLVQETIVLEGHVTGNASGEPLSGVYLSCLKDGVQVEGATTIVGQDGAYRMEIAAGPGRYRVYPHNVFPEPYEQFAPLGQDVGHLVGGPVTQDLILPDPFTLSLKVLDLDGNVIILRSEPQLHFNMAPVTGKPGWTYGSAIRAHSDAPGCYTWRYLSVDGLLRVEASAPGYADAEADFHIPNGAAVDASIVLYGLTELVGCCTDASGSALSDRRIEIIARYADGRELTTRTKTDTAGAFTTQIPATSCDLELRTIGSSSGLQWRAASVAFEEGTVNDLGYVVLSE